MKTRFRYGSQVKAAISSSDLKHLSRFSSSSDPPEQQLTTGNRGFRRASHRNTKTYRPLPPDGSFLFPIYEIGDFTKLILRKCRTQPIINPLVRFPLGTESPLLGSALLPNVGLPGMNPDLVGLWCGVLDIG
uniref:RNA polymerase beta chain n=1 Tax=Solanum tuberosum TaxID=4113 RepID=M1C3N1_SOLTU